MPLFNSMILRDNHHTASPSKELKEDWNRLHSRPNLQTHLSHRGFPDQWAYHRLPSQVTYPG
jgi:hypothetical protein